MSKKKIILSVVAFLVSFIISVIIFFPITPIAEKYIKNIITQRNLDLRYDKMNITFFGADVTNLRTGPVVIKKISLDYNPIGLLFKNVKFNVTSNLINAKGEFSNNTLTSTIKSSVAEIAKVSGSGAEGSGTINGSINYSVEKKQGEINLQSTGAVNIKHQLITLELETLKGIAKINNNVVNIEKLSATGKNTLDVTGSISINPAVLNSSVLNISGTASMNNFPIKFKLNGPARSPSFQLQ